MMSDNSPLRLPSSIAWRRSFAAHLTKGRILIVTQRGGWQVDLVRSCERRTFASAPRAEEALRAAESYAASQGTTKLGWNLLLATEPTKGVRVSVWGTRRHGFSWALTVRGWRLDQGHESTVGAALAGAEAAIVRRLLLSPQRLLQLGAQPAHHKEDESV